MRGRSLFAVEFMKHFNFNVSVELHSSFTGGGSDDWRLGWLLIGGWDD